MIELAKKFARTYHSGHLDKAGADYYENHLIPVYEDVKEMGDIYAVSALLHDILEDTDVREDVIADVFGEDVYTIVKILTHRKGETYFDYIARIKENKIATAIKLADLKSNSDLSRLSKIRDGDLARLKRYEKAIKILSNESEVKAEL